MTNPVLEHLRHIDAKLDKIDRGLAGILERLQRLEKMLTGRGTRGATVRIK